MSTVGVFSTPGGYHEHTGGVQYTGGFMSTPGAYHDECGGYHEYTGGCSVHWGDSMSTPGVYHDESGGYHEYFVNRNIGQCLQSTLGKLPATGSLSASNLR